MTGGLHALAAVAALVATAPSGGPWRAPRRAERLIARGDAGGRPASAARGTSAVGRAGAALLVGAAVVTLVPGAAVLAPPSAVVAWLVLGRLEPSSVRRRRGLVVQATPAATDLLVACLEAGATQQAALAAVGDAVDGPVGEALRSAARAKALGASSCEVLRGWEADVALAPLLPVGAALARSEDEGVQLVDTLHRVADDLRSARTHRVAAAAGRAGVRAAAPLGLCFLPAFVLVGLVPVLLALTG